MKQIISKSGWLVMAAALTMGMSLSTGLTSCSSDDDVVQTPPAKGVSTVHVSVNAGVDNGTRSIVETTTVGSKTTRTLQFTTGDQLYVYGRITPDGVFPEKYIAGFLDNQATENGTTEATFSGDLTVYEMTGTYNPETGQYDNYKLVPDTYDFSGSDPLVGTTATLFHDRASGNMFIDNDTKEVCFNEAAIGSSVDDLMTSLLEVKAEYNASSKDFSLSPASGCIVNCTISNMPGIGYYTVSYWSGPSLKNLTKQTERELSWEFPANDFTFAFFGKTGTDYYHQVRITNATYGTTVIDLGKKTLSAGTNSNKIYNVASRSWETFAITSNTSTPVPGPVNKTYTFASDCDIDVSGTGVDKMIVLNSTENVVYLKDITVTNTTGGLTNGDFIMLYNYDQTSVAATINVKGDNSVACLADGKNAITSGSNGGNTVKFCGNGTFTVTTKSPDNCGIFASNYTTDNNQHEVTGECNVSAQLAYDATECKVTRSARTDNEDGTYTWTYTVRTFFAVSANKDFTVNYGVYQFNDGNVTARVSGPTNNERLEFKACPVDLTITNLEVNQTSPSGNFIESLGNADSQPSIVITINGQNSVNLSKLPVEWNNNAPANFINCVGGLALQGNGTLTITTADPDNCGIIAANYTNKGTDAYTFPQGAELGNKSDYIVTRSARTYNGDGTYTWTYTVRPR